MTFKEIFKDCRIAALVGNKQTGKTNNIFFMIKELRKENKDLMIYAYGMPEGLTPLLIELDVLEISSLTQMVKKRNCLLILDDFQKLKLNDRRYRDALNEFADFIYHNNIYCLLSSPNIREFNSIIGNVIERWLLKSINIDDCINGSHLKKVVEEYKGKYKSLGCINFLNADGTPNHSDILLINNEKEVLLHCEYMPEADTKKNLKQIFGFE